MNQKRKRLGLWILFLAALLLTQFTVPVKASEPQIQDVNIQMVGGQIRTIDPMGLRMVACIKKSYIQELEKSGATVSYGIVLLPKKYLTEGQALTLDGKYLYNGSVYKPAKVPAVKKFSEDNERIYFTAVLANLPKERYKNDYAARAYAEITRTVIEDDGKKKTTTEVVYSESEIDRQVYRIAEEAVNGTTEAEETKQWLRDNILAPVDTPEELPEEEKKISFRLGKVSGVTLYHKTTSEAGVETVEEVSQFNLTEFKKEDYLVKVEMEDQPEIFAGITEVIAPQTETGKVSFKLDRKDYTTSQAGQTIEGAVVEFGTKSNDKVSTKYITMQALIDQMKANPSGTYTLEHDIDASMVQASESLVPTFSGTFNGNGYKIKGLTSTLFGTVSNGKIENVKLENVSITKSMSDSFKDAGAGTLANKAASNTVIENVHVNGSLRNPNTRSLLGGLVGRMDHAKISKCSANVEISGSLNTTGGLVGQMSNNTTGPNIIENSYAVGTISGTQVNGAVGGLIGWHNSRQSGSVTNCYAAVTVKITKSGNVKDPGGLIGYIGNSDSTGIIKSNVSFSTGTSGYKFDGSTENTKYTSAQTEKLYSLRESSLKRESSRTGNTNLTQITDVTVDKLSQKEFYTNMGWSEDVWDFAPLKEGKTPILQEIKTLEELQTVGQNKYTKYVLKNDIDASTATTGKAVAEGVFKGEFDGGGFTIKGLKKPLFEKVQEGTVRNLKIENAEINSTEESSKNAVITKESNHAVFESLNLADIKVSGVSYNAVVTGYDYTSSVFSKIQIRNAQITGTKNYNAVLAGRASGSQIQDVAVIGSSVALSGTDCGGFIGEGKNVTISRVYSDADMTVNTYTDDKNRTQSAGFIGNLTGKSSVEYVFAAGKVDNKTSEQLYNFIGTPDALKTMVKNSFVIQNAGGVSNITDGVGQEILREATSQEAATSDFYKTSMTLNEETWNLSLVPMKGYPELKGMEKREVISVKTAEDFMKMKDFPTQEYRLKADIDLSGTEQTGSVIPEFSGVLDGENHKITGLKAPLFGQLSGTVSNVAIDAGAIEIGNNVDTTVGIFANTMTNATVEKVMIANGSISSTAGKAAGFAGTVTDSTVKNIFIQGIVNAVSTASGFAETSHHSVMENIYVNIDVNGADGAGFLVNSTGENSYKNICSIGNVAENMYKLAKTDITFTNAYELSAADGISSAAEANGVKTIGKEVWTKAFYTETLKLDISVWDVENAETNGYPLLKEFNVNLSPMTVEIQKPQDIRKLNKLPEGRFTITADLDFTEYGAANITENIAENSIENNADINAADSVENSAENHAEETAQAGTCLVTETFTGSINGGGHKVSGMKSAMFKQLSGKIENLEFRNVLVDNETAGANVLAETTQSANVKNVHFNGITLRGAGYTGMIGKDTGSTFSQISVQNADVTTRADYAGVFAANAAGTQIFDVLITDTEVATSNAYVGGFIGNAERITAQKVFADAELNIPYTVSTQNTAAFIGQASEDSKIQYSTAAGGVYPEDPSSTRYKLTHMDNSSNLNELKAFTNCFINTDTPGYDSIANDPKGVTHEALCGTEFYTNEMRLSQDVWDLSDVAGTGTPSLKTMPEEDVRAPETAPTPEEEIPMQETAPEGYTEIRTAEELLAIRDSSDKYILMSSISLYDAEPQDGSFLGDFKGELNGNGLTIREVYGAPLFNTLSGKVENLKLTDVKVEAWSQNQGANAFAKTLSGATVSKVALKNILVAGGNNTGALAGTAQNSTVSEVWAEGLNVNPYGPIHGQNDAMVGGLIAKLKGGCHISDSYVGGEITVNGNTQGGVFGYNSEFEDGATNNTVKQVVSNMKTKAISGQTDGAGFIGMVGYNDVGKWMENSIAIGEASVNREHGSIGEAYRFTSTTGYSMREGLENCYEAKVGGKSNISPGDLDETSRYKEKSFYQDTLKFDSSKWSFTSVEQKGHPTLSWIAGAEPLPPLPEGSAVTTHKQLKTEVPQGYTAIRTPADFMKIAENPSGKYILMNNISLEQVKLAEGQTSYIMKRFEGELDGNNQVIHGLRASLFDSISGTSSKKAVVKNLRVQNVFVNAGYKDQWGNIVRAEANGLAREVSNGRLETIYMNCVNLNGGSNTAALAGMADKTYIGKVWLEEVDINSGVSAEELGKFYYVGGVIGRLTDSTSKFEDSYAEGKIIMDSGQQGGVIGELQSATVRNVISNMEASGNPLQPWMKKGGFLGDVALYGQNNNKWKLDRCISIGNAGNNYKFLGKDISADTTTNLNTCYEFLGATGVTSVTDATIEKGILLATDNIKDITLYQDTLSFNDDTDGADSTAWDFSSVAEKGYPTLTWLLTYDGAAATMVEQTPVQDQEQEAAQDENLAEPEVNLPDQDEYLKED